MTDEKLDRLKIENEALRSEITRLCGVIVRATLCDILKDKDEIKLVAESYAETCIRQTLKKIL